MSVDPREPAYRRGVLFAVALALGVGLVATRGGRLPVSTDSTFYLSAARTIAARHQIASAILFTERLARAGNGESRPGLQRWPREVAEAGESSGVPRELHPYTAWPPGYPVLLALLMSLGVSGQAAALALAVAAIVAIVVAAAAIGRRLGGARIGVAAGCAVACAPYLHQTDVAFVGSDLTCAALTLSSLAALAAFLDERRLRWLFAASLAAACAASTRYVAVLLVPVLLLAVLPGRRLGALLVAGLPVPLVIAPILARNVALGGALFGAERLPSDRGLVANLGDLLRTLVVTLPITPDGARRIGLLFSGFITLGLFAFIAVRLRRTDVRRPPALVPLVAFALAHVALVVALRTRTLADEVGPRLLLPALLVTTIVAVASIGVRLEARVRPVVAAAFCALCAVATIVTALGRPFRGFGSAQMRLRAAEVSASLGATAPAQLFSDRVVELHAARETPVHWLPAPRNLPALQNAQGPLAFVIQRGTAFFPCSAMANAYAAMLTSSADRLTHGPTFDVYWLGGSKRVTPEEAAAVEATCP